MLMVWMATILVLACISNSFRSLAEQTWKFAANMPKHAPRRPPSDYAMSGFANRI
jgi:hypothetical protein